jgi:nitroimidazol reductase NimA-like FMN-containing flavoprotein (pyridoxamine 5'-phosphate oxidase superfamily)
MIHTGFTEAESAFVRNERVLRFNSSDETGMIHSVPVCYAFDGNNFFIHARRHNAKRWKNIKANSSVSLELDSYSDDWSKLKGVLVYGTAQFIESEDDKKVALGLLREKYRQYREGSSALTTHDAIVKVLPNKVTSWYLAGSSTRSFGSY